MLVEGRGRVAPKPERVKITRGELAYFQKTARIRAGFRRYGARGDEWGRGLAKPGDPVFPILAGLLGEFAVCAFLNSRLGTKIQPDTSLLVKGDGGRDLIVCGICIQVKTRVTAKTNLVRRIDGSKRLRGLDSGIFVFCQWRSGNLHVDLLGWLDAQFIRHSAEMKRGRGDWWNLCLRDENLEPMARLIARLSSGEDE